MEYKVIPGFEDRFEIGQDGIVRNVKTKRETKPYHTSEKTGPMVHLLDTKKNKEARLSVIRLVHELFNEKLAGWDLDPDTIKIRENIERKPRLSSEEKAARSAEKERLRAEKLAAKQRRAEEKKAERAAVLEAVDAAV